MGVAAGGVGAEGVVGGGPGEGLGEVDRVRVVGASQGANSAARTTRATKARQNAWSGAPAERTLIRPRPGLRVRTAVMRRPPSYRG